MFYLNLYVLAKEFVNSTLRTNRIETINLQTQVHTLQHTHQSALYSGHKKKVSIDIDYYAFHFINTSATTAIFCSGYFLPVPRLAAIESFHCIHVYIFIPFGP